MTLGKNIRYLRKKNGWSQEFLAERLGYRNYTSIQKWESEVAEPRFATVQKLSDIFNVAIDDLTNTDMELAEFNEKSKGVREIFTRNYQAVANLEGYGDLSEAKGILFKATADATEEELIQTAQYLNFLKQTRKE